MDDDPFFQAFMQKYSGSNGGREKSTGDPYLDSFIGTTKRKKKEWEAQAEERNFAEELKKEQEAEAAKEAEKKDEGGRNIFQKAGGFVKDAGVGIWHDAKDTYKGGKDALQGFLATRQMEKNTEELNKNSKEWNEFMRTLPEGDEEAWSKPEVQEKLKEFRYKALLIQGREAEARAEDIPESAKNWNKGEDGKGGFEVGPDGRVSVKQPMADPYQKYRDSAISERTRKDMGELQEIDERKLAVASASTFLNVATLGVGTGAKAGAKQGVTVALKEGAKAGAKQGIKTGFKAATGEGVKGLAKQATKDASVGAMYGLVETFRDPENGLDDMARNMLIGGAIGAAAPVALKGAGRVVKGADKQAGKAVAKTTEKVATSGTREMTERMSAALSKMETDGIFGTLDKFASNTGRSAAYKISDAIGSTKVGSKVIGMKDRFMEKWVSEFHPLYKALKRQDFENKTNTYAAAREVIGNANRSTAFAQQWVEKNPNMQQLAAALAADNLDSTKNLNRFVEFAKNKSEMDLATAGKKTFSKGKTTEVTERLSKLDEVEQAKYGEMYDMMVKGYKDLNKLRHENGLISDETFKYYEDNPVDYIRVQRELPDWMLEKGAAGHSSKSINSTGNSVLNKKRNKFAEAEQLSPVETMLATVQVAHSDIYRNKAATTIAGLIDELDSTKILRSTDMVKEKQKLLTALKETKPIASRVERTLRVNKKQLRNLEVQMNRLSKEGLAARLSGSVKGDMPEAFRYLNVDEVRAPRTVKGKTTQPLLRQDALTGTATTRLTTTKGANMRDVVKALVAEDPARLKQIRRMLEKRDEKLAPLLDTIEVLNKELNDIYAERKGIWSQANKIKTDVKKGNKTTFSFMDNGVENIVETDPAIAAAIGNWTGNQQTVLNDFFRMTNNIFRFGTTSGNVAFALPNMAADVPSAFINSKNGKSFVNPITFLDSLNIALGGRPMTNSGRAIAEGYKKANAGQLTVNQYQKKASSKQIAQEFARSGAKNYEKLFTVIRHPKQVPRAIARTMDDLIGVTENTTRIQAKRAEYIRLTKKGIAHEEADRLSNLAARENSVDFLEMGKYGRVANSLYPYFNASIQGSRTMLRSLSERPVSTAGKIAVIVGVPTVATTVWNVSNEERKQIYDTIPEYVKDTNFVLIKPGASWNEEKRRYDGVILMKKPPGFKEFAEPVRRYVEYAASNGDPTMGSFLDEKGGDMAGDFSQSFSPIDFSDKWKFLNSIVPQALKPTAQAITNKDFFTGQDIVPGSMEDLPPEEQRYEDYGQLTGYLGNMFGQSPIQIDKWIKSTFGEFGTNVQYAADTAMGAPEEHRGGRSLTESVKRRFSGAPGGQDRQVFFDTYTPAKKKRNLVSLQVTELVKAGRINEAKRRAEEYNNSLADRFSGFMDQFKKSPTYDPEWDEMINSLPIKTSESAFRARRK